MSFRTWLNAWKSAAPLKRSQWAPACRTRRRPTGPKLYLEPLVKLRFYAGLTLEDAAKALNIARRTADRYWAFARSWLFEELRTGDEAES